MRLAQVGLLNTALWTTSHQRSVADLPSLQDWLPALQLEPVPGEWPGSHDWRLRSPVSGQRDTENSCLWPRPLSTVIEGFCEPSRRKWCGMLEMGEGGIQIRG